jgi:hypothetical protein
VLAPIDIANSLIWMLTPTRAVIVNPMRIGNINNICPITIPVGVKRSFKNPKGPCLDISRKRKSPTITVGIL